MGDITSPITGGGGITPQKLAMTAIPFIIAPTGTMANNGAITLGTALPTTYTNAYIYLPASAIQAGSAAGWYFCQMSSTTVGTVFNNTYASGAVSIPSTPTPFVTTGPGAYTGVITAVNGPTITIPGGTVGPNSTLKIFHLWSQPSTAGNKTDALVVGGVALYSAAFGTGATNNAVETNILSRGSQAAQVVPAGNNNGYGFNGSACNYTTINFANAQTVVMQGTLATATDFIVMEALLIELTPG